MTSGLWSDLILTVACPEPEVGVVFECLFGIFSAKNFYASMSDFIKAEKCLAEKFREWVSGPNTEYSPLSTFEILQAEAHSANNLIVIAIRNLHPV